MIRVACRFRPLRGPSLARSSVIVPDFFDSGRETRKPILPPQSPKFLTFPIKNRAFSSSASQDNNSNSSVDDTLEKLFQESQKQLQGSNGSDDAWYAAAEQVAAGWDPTWYNVADQAVLFVKYFHELSGLQYGWSIVGVTVLLRLALFPVMVQSQRNTSRMAHLQPELHMIKQRYEAIGSPTRQDQLQFSNQMKSLFAKYKVKPLRAFLAPVIQFPVFMGMFFGLKKMPDLYPNELAAGGMFWFPDLTVPDPLYILPMASAGTFLLLIEMGKDQMMASSPGTAPIMINVFRFLAITMIPVCIKFHAGMLCYWTANNLLTITQTGILKLPKFRKAFGIWDPPKPVPGMQADSISETASKIMKQLLGKDMSDEQKIKRHNAVVEARKKTSLISKSTRKGITGTRNV